MDNVTLLSGNHQSREQGVCVMEAVAWFAGEAHSDAPHCACPIIAAFARRLNDRLDDAQRQRLKPLVPALALSRADWPVTLKRAFVAADYAVRVFAPIALEARGLTKAATKLRALPEIQDRASALKGQRAADATAAAAAASADASAAAYAAAYAAAATAADAAAAYAAAVGASRSQRRLADLGIECLEKMLAA